MRCNWTNINFNQTEDIELYSFARYKHISKLVFSFLVTNVKAHAFKKLPTNTPRLYDKEKSLQIIAKNSFLIHLNA